MKHGYWGHPLYWVWSDIKKRCANPNNKNYRYYGSRGIKVCSEWLEAKTFIEWALANGWRPGLTIDRIDNDGDYCPENCRFVTQAENNKNRPQPGAKLNQRQVDQIREISKNRDLTQKEIAGLFGIKQETVSRIVNFKRWA